MVSPMVSRSLLVLASLVLATGCDVFPWMEQPVKLPDGSSVRIMIRSGGEHRTVVQNAYGRVSVSNQAIIDGNRWTNLYLTPKGQLVTIEGGGAGHMFDLTPGQKPRALSTANKALTLPVEKREAYLQTITDASYKWKYLGVVVRGHDGLAYFTPREAPECLPLYGAGFSLYRKKYQSEHSCDHPDVIAFERERDRQERTTGN